MFQTAIGRVQSIIELPPKSLDMWVFVDAGGKANNQRVWGGLAAIGESELYWIERLLADIGGEDSESSELKGRELETEIIKLAGRKIIEEDRRILFWANWLLDWSEPKSHQFNKRFGEVLQSLKPNPHNLNQVAIEAWQKDMAECFEKLKPVNKHKLLSIILHIQWLISELKRIQIGSQLKSVHLVVDNENFPDEARCGTIIKFFLSAGLQSSGMDCTLTGTTYREEPTKGSVSVNVRGESKKSVGIRYVDVLLQAVLRKVMPITE